VCHVLVLEQDVHVLARLDWDADVLGEEGPEHLEVLICKKLVSASSEDAGLDGVLGIGRSYLRLDVIRLTVGEDVLDLVACGRRGALELPTYDIDRENERAVQDWYSLATLHELTTGILLHQLREKILRAAI
jgi:predicted small lipoprotein YifL